VGCPVDGGGELLAAELCGRDVGQSMGMAGRVASQHGDRGGIAPGGGDREERRPVGDREDAASLEKHGSGAGEVPQRRAMIVDEIEAAHRRVAELQRGRAEAPQAMTT
jgi:hypothetical protein